MQPQTAAPTAPQQTTPLDLARALTDAVDELRAARAESAGNTVAGPCARGRHAARVKRQRRRIERLVAQAEAAGLNVRDEIWTPFDDYRCTAGCGYFGRMTLCRDLVANEQQRVCPDCGEVQRSRPRPIY